MKDQLSEDVAGHLQNQIDEHEKRITRLESIAESGEVETGLITTGGEKLVADDGGALIAFWRYQIM